jgi:chromodomain-helicase-DNA-binding protein 7
MDHIVLMTGTPLQNDMLELWSLLHFIEPEKFADADTFLSRFGSMREASTLAELHDELRPYMLRRLKEDVEKSIPAKEETIVDVELTIKQKKYYRAIFERNRDILTGPVVKPKPEGGGGVPHSTGRSKGPSLINLEMEMRKCCCHPYMIDGIQDSEIVECQRSNAKQGKAVTTRADEIEHMIHCSGKMILLHKLLPKLRAEGHRVLIFSQFRYMLTLIGLLLEYHEMKYERLDGMVRGNERQKAIDRFSADEDTFAFLLSTKAGGVGLNLQSADTVILYDSDWNPQNDLQAQARAHRIGQTKPVRVYRLITTKTYEAEMFAKSSKKLGLSTAVFKHGTLEGGEATISDNRGGGGGMMSLLTMDKDEVEMLLRYGAYAILDKDDDSSANQFTEATIDQLLAKCTTIRYDSDKKTAGSSLNGGVSQPVPSLSLSKASFMASTEDGKVNFGDENFWEKILGPKPVDRLMKFVRDGKLETVNLDQTREFLVEVGELVRSVRNSRSEGKVHSDTESIMEILIELKVRGSPDKSIDQKQLATFWIDLIENSRRRRNKKTSNACPKPKGPGKSWGVYGYSDDEDDDEGIKERPSVEEVPSSSDDDDEEDLGVLSMTDELMETEENVSGYISGITVRVKRKFGGFHATISAPNKESRGGVYVMAEPPKKLKISQGIKVLKILMMDPQSYVFRFPVDPEAQGLYDYNDVVKHSVCLSSILENAQNGMYGNHLDKCVSDQFYRDLNLVWYNCMLYNKDGSFICQLAKRMKIKCDLLLKSYDKMNAK